MKQKELIDSIFKWHMEMVTMSGPYRRHQTLMIIKAMRHVLSMLVIGIGDRRR